MLKKSEQQIEEKRKNQVRSKEEIEVKDGKEGKGRESKWNFTYLLVGSRKLQEMWTEKFGHVSPTIINTTFSVKDGPFT